MRKMFRALFISSAIAMMVVAFAITGCSRGPNEKELQALEETKSAALAAESKLSDCQSEKASLESQLAEKKQKLEEMKQEKADVQNRLSNF